VEEKERYLPPSWTWGRSKQIKEIAKFFSSKSGRNVAFIVAVPNLGEYRLSGEALLEFIWALRSYRPAEMLAAWLDKVASTQATQSEDWKEHYIAEYNSKRYRRDV